MKSVAIRNNYNLEQHAHKLHFDELPLVVAYIRYGHTPALSELPGPQMASIVRMLTGTFGQYGFNVIWVIEEASGSARYREGLALVAELLSSGYGKYLAISRIDRLTRSLRTYADLDENVLVPNDIQMLVAAGPESGPGPGSTFVSRFVNACARVQEGGRQDG